MTPPDSQAAFEAWFLDHRLDLIPWIPPEDKSLAIARWAFLAAWHQAQHAQRQPMPPEAWFCRLCQRESLKPDLTHYHAAGPG